MRYLNGFEFVSAIVQYFADGIKERHRIGYQFRLCVCMEYDILFSSFPLIILFCLTIDQREHRQAFVIICHL